MTSPGSWGDWAIIEHPKRKRKKITTLSCEMCTYYRSHTKCKYFNNINATSSWKTCDKIYFKIKYDTPRYWNALARLRRK